MTEIGQTTAVKPCGFFGRMELFLIAAALSLNVTTAVAAATPVVVWDGDAGAYDFSTLTRTVGDNTYTLNLNPVGSANTVAADSSYIQIANADAQCGVTITTQNSDPAVTNGFGTSGTVSVLMKCCDMPVTADSNRAIISLMDGKKYKYGGTTQQDNGAVLGMYIANGTSGWIWKGSTAGMAGLSGNFLNTVSGKFSADEQVVALTYSNSGGTCYYVNGELAQSESGLKDSSGLARPYGVALGGLDVSTGSQFFALKNMKIEAIAVFSSALTADEVASYKFPSEVPMSGTVTVSDINTLFGSKSEINIHLADGTTVTGDTTFNATTVHFVSAGEVVLYPPAGNAATLDFSGVTKPVIAYNGLLPTQSGSTFTSTTVPTGVTDSAQWTGTVWIKNYAGITGNNFLPNNYGNASSTLRLTGVSGWIWSATSNNTINPAVELYDDGGPYGLCLSDGYGYGGGGNYFTIFSELKGTGTLVAYNKASYVLLNVRKWDDFSGTLSLTNKIVCFGSTIPASSEFSDANGGRSGGLVWVASDATLDIPRPWHLGNTTAFGNVVVEGALSYASLANIPSSEKVVLRQNGKLNVPGASSAADFARDFTKVSGEGTVRLTAATSSPWVGLPTNNLMTTLGVEISRGSLVIPPDPGNTAHSTNVFEIGSLSGVGSIQGNYGDYDAYRRLRILQSTDTTWSGNVLNDARNRLYEIAVAPGASSVGTLEIAGSNTNKSTILTVESGAKVNLTGTWKGPVSVSGTLSGTGTFTGDVRLFDGATLKVGDFDSAVLQLSSTYTGASWFLPESLAISWRPSPCMTVSSAALRQDLGDMTMNAVVMSVLAEIPEGKSGAVLGLGLTNGSTTYSVYAYANGDGTFTIYYGNGQTTGVSKSSGVRNLSGVHLYTLACCFDSGLRFYENGVEIASDANIKWTSGVPCKPGARLTFGSAIDGNYPLAGMKIYKASTTADNGSGIYEKAANAYADLQDEVAESVPALKSETNPTIRAIIIDNYAKYGITTETVTLNGTRRSFAESARIINLFGPSSLEDDGVTFNIGGIDMSDGTIRLDVSPAVAAGNSLSVFGKAELSNRWRRLKVNPEGSSVSIYDEGLADCRFFQIRAEMGEKAVGNPVSENPSTGDGGTTEPQSHFAPLEVGGSTTLFTFSLDGGEPGDYAANYYKALAFQVEGVTAGAVATLSTNGAVAASAEVGENGSVSFGNVPPLGSGTTLSFGVSTANAEGKITTANLDEKAGVLSYTWGDGEETPVAGGVTNVVTTLANRPFADGMKDSDANGWYRIPAMAMATNGAVVALYDCRLRSSGDLPNSIDWAESWSGDGGVTWTRPHIAVDVTNVLNQTLGKETDISDPCILYDPGSNRFFAMGITGGGLSSNQVNGVSIADVVLYVRGTGEFDAWQRWTGGPVGKERSVKQMVLDGLAEAEGNETIRNEDAIRGILQGPGHGFVQRKEVTDGEGDVIMPMGALVFPMQYFPANDFKTTQNFALYSTDSGATWVATALTPTSTPAGEPCYAQEGCIVELDDGTWEYMAKYGQYDSNVDTAYGASQDDDARENCRLFFRSKDFKTWTFDGYHPHKSVRSQGSCLWLGDAVKNANGGTSLYAACFSTSGHHNKGQRRGSLKLFIGRDTSSEPGQQGITWDRDEIEIRHEHTSACSYNSMVMLDDRTLGVLFESNGHIYLRKVDLSRFLNPSE